MTLIPFGFQYNPAAYHLISILMDHNDNLDESTIEKRNKIVDFIQINCALAKDFDAAEIHHILGILSVNSFVVHDGGEDESKQVQLEGFMLVYELFKPLTNSYLEEMKHEERDQAKLSLKSQRITSTLKATEEHCRQLVK